MDSTSITNQLEQNVYMLKALLEQQAHKIAELEQQKHILEKENIYYKERNQCLELDLAEMVNETTYHIERNKCLELDLAEMATDEIDKSNNA
jgi:hypothetical protein